MAAAIGMAASGANSDGRPYPNTALSGMAGITPAILAFEADFPTGGPGPLNSHGRARAVFAPVAAVDQTSLPCSILGQL